MLTIVGSGIGEYNFSNLPSSLNIEEFDKIICDKNFSEDGESILKVSYKDAKEYILKNYKSKNLLYIVTGSPIFFSAGVIMAKLVPREYLKIIHNISSKDYILSALGINESKVESISLHGRVDIDLEKFLKRRFTLILSDSFTIDRLLSATEFISSDDLRWIIGYKMGYSDEFIGEFNPKKHHFDLKKPFVILIERRFDYPKTPLKDINFSTERGMITKEFKRNSVLQSLKLYPNLTLWDIGAGSGSVAIEAFRAFRVKTILFEKNPKRVEFIKDNLTAHRVCDTELFEGEASEYFKQIPKNPDRVFIGGGGSRVISKIPYLFERLNSEGVMIIMAVTIRSLKEATDILELNQIEYTLTSLNLTSWSGNLKMAEPQRELFIISISKS